MENLTPFHVAVPVHNLELARQFYTKILNCKEGRSSDQWIDFDLYGHQYVVHYQARAEETTSPSHNAVDGHAVPIPHYGVVLRWDDWQALSQKLIHSGIDFIIKPYIRFEGEVGEQATMFFSDPSGNALEFKAFKNIDQLFAK